MAYATTGDVQLRMAQIGLSNVTTLTLAQLSTIIDDVAAEIDVELSSRNIAVPITAPAWYVTRLRALNADGAAAIALKSIFPEVTLGGSPPYAFYQQRYADGLNALRIGTIPVELIPTSHRIMPSTYLTAHPEDDVKIEGGSMFDVGRRP